MMILSTFVNEDLLANNETNPSQLYQFSPSGVYSGLSIHTTKLQDMLDKAIALPTIDNPEIFGMNDNADLAF